VAARRGAGGTGRFRRPAAGRLAVRAPDHGRHQRGGRGR
jgi:hypothetical protein